MTKEKREFLGNFGDIDWIEYDGLFLFKTQYGIEAHKIEVCPEYSNDNIIDDIYDPDMYWTIYRFDVERMFLKNGNLVNEYDHKEWYSKNIEGIVSCVGSTELEFITLITSEDTVDQLMAYEMISSYYGFFELDNYPLKVNVKELKEMYNDIKGLCDLDLRRCKKVKKD